MKCVVCGKNTVNVDHIIQTPQNVEALLKNDIDYHEMWLKEPDSIINTPNGPRPVICELDWIALMWNGGEYWWNGEKLMVWNQSEMIFEEAIGRRWKPAHPVGIAFELSENGKWEVKAA